MRERVWLRPPGGARASGWEPALDGLRGVAVVAVLLYHHSPDAVPGGFLGVSLFFTLSGYLITTLLLRKHAESGGISLRRFWIRRARRLVPVALAGLALATLVAWWTRTKGGLAAVSSDVRYAAANLANWHQIGEGADYGDALTAPSPVTHYWSLAIEEQYYLVYPVVAALALRYRRRALTTVLLLATAASFAAQVLATSTNRAYLGTDTRLAELTIGGLLATYLAARRPHAQRRRWDALGIAGLAALGVAWLTIELGDERLFEGGLILHALVAAAVIAAARHGWRLPRVLGQPALVSLGLLSYGVYVVHFPMYLLLTPERTPLDGPALLAVRVVASVALAAGLHWLVERPVRWGGSLPGWHGALGWATATAAVVVLAVAMPHVGRTGGRTELQAGLRNDETTVLTMPTPDLAAPATTTSTTATTSRAQSSAGPDLDPAPPPIAPSTASPSTPVALRPLRLLVVGDSTAAANGAGMQRWAEQTGRAAVDVVTGPGCAFEQTGVAIVRDGWEQPTRRACLDLLKTARALATQHPPDAVIVFIGSIQLADWRLPDGSVRAIGDLVFEQRYKTAAHAALATLESIGAPVLWATVPVPSWDPSKQFDFTPPGSGPLTINDAGRTARLNSLNPGIAQVGHPLLRLVPYAELISEPDGSVDPALRPDGMHLAEDEVPGLMADGLERLLRDAYRSVLQVRPDAQLAGRNVWSG